MPIDKTTKKYLENMPYGNDALSSEIHGKLNQQIVNAMIISLVKQYDEAMSRKDKSTAKYYKDAIYQISRDLDGFKEQQKELAMVLSNDMMSNYTDTRWSQQWLLENCRVSFNEELRPVFSVMMPSGEELTKSLVDISEDWVTKGTEEAEYMRMQQDAVKQRNTMGVPLDFDVDWAVDNLLNNQDAWKVFATDKIGGRYFLHDYLQENEEALNTGEITDEMLHPDSFNPEFDTRLFDYYSSRIKKSYDPNYQSLQEKREADKLMNKTNISLKA